MTARNDLGLAATKLRPPAPPSQLVQRPRLTETLDTGTEDRVRLVLVSAPAGSGKSTLVASWLADRPTPAAWLQLEAGDSDPARFWSYLGQAIEGAHPAVAGRLEVATAGRDDHDSVVTTLVNVLGEAGGPLVIVVDDYQLVDNPVVHRGVERLIDLCPENVTVVLVTRTDPPFRLGRLRVRGQMVEVRAAGLRFETDEAAVLLSRATAAPGSPLSPEHVARLCERTEGWAAGLVLAALSLAGTEDPDAFIEAFRGDDQLVVDYLRDEYLAVLRPDDRRRLLETSVLDQLTGGLVDAVTDSTGGAAWLGDIAAANQLVIGLDRSRTWFRYHHLLRDLLRLEAEQTFPQRVPELHARAAEWFEAADDHGGAITHRLAAGDTDAVTRLLLVHGPWLIAQGRVDTLRAILDQLGDVARRVTWCALFYGWCEFLAGRYASAEDWLDAMVVAASDDFDHVVATPLRMNLSLARGDVASALTVARRMSETGQLVNHPADLATAVGAAHAWAGQADEARTALRLAVEKAAVAGLHTAQVLALVYLALVELEAGTTAEARAAANRAVETAADHGLAEYHGMAPAYAIRACTAGDPARARVEVAHALELSRRGSTDLALGFVLTTCADTLLDQGDVSGAPLLLEARAVLRRCVDPGVAARRLARAESRHGMTQPVVAPVGDLVEQLTDRELAVLRYLPLAMSQRDIAAELFVSLNTVKTHSRAVYRKLGVGDRKAAVQAARDLDLI